MLPDTDFSCAAGGKEGKTAVLGQMAGDLLTNTDTLCLWIAEIAGYCGRGEEEEDADSG